LTENTPYLNLPQSDLVADGGTKLASEWINDINGVVSGGFGIIDAAIEEHVTSTSAHRPQDVGVNDSTITIKQGGIYRGSFSLNQSYDKTIDLDFDDPVPSPDPVFANNTWLDISLVTEFIRANQLDASEVRTLFGWNIGDQKPISVGGITYNFRIIGVSHDDLSDGSGKAGLTLELTTTWDASGARINTTSNQATSWINSMMRLGSVGGGGIPNVDEAIIPFIRDLINNSNEGAAGHRGSNLMAVVKTVDKRTAGGSGSGGAGSTILISQDDLFLLSGREVTGTNLAGALGMTWPGEGDQYLWYQSNIGIVNRIKTPPSDTTPLIWWLRSPVPGMQTSYFAIAAAGSNTSLALTTARGVSFALCI